MSSSPPNKKNNDNIDEFKITKKVNKRKRDTNEDIVDSSTSNTITERKIKKRRKNISKVIKDLVLERQGVRCNICNILWNTCFELDHIIPRSVGGTDEQDNLQFLCNSCHKYKTYKIDQITRDKIERKKRVSKLRIISLHRKNYISLISSNIERKREDIKYNIVNSIYSIINDLKDTSIQNKTDNLNNYNMNNKNNINNTIDLSNDNLYNNSKIDSIENNINNFRDDGINKNHLNNQIKADKQLDNILGKINIIIENYNNFNSRREQLSNHQNSQGNNNILNKIKGWVRSKFLPF
jgi:5-methylcytosine-specific restriction endonuclease McrA